MYCRYVHDMYFNYFALRDNSVLLAFFAEKTQGQEKLKIL